MDERDRRILEVLVDEGDAKLTKIARKTGLPVTTVYTRIKKLKEEGILRIRGEIDLRKLGYGIEFFVVIDINTAVENVNQENVIREIVKIPGVVEAYVITGSKDIIVRGFARNIEELSDIVLKKLRGIRGVADTETMVVLSRVRADDRKFLVEGR